MGPPKIPHVDVRVDDRGAVVLGRHDGANAWGKGASSS